MRYFIFGVLLFLTACHDDDKQYKSNSNIELNDDGSIKHSQENKE